MRYKPKAARKIARNAFWGVFFLATYLLLPTTSSAQSPVNVTATVKDSAGIPYSNATVSILLIPTGTAPTVGGAQISGTNNGQLDVNGKLNVSLYKNTDIVPASSQWQFTICETPGIALPLGTGGQCFTSSQTVSAAVDFSTQFQAAAKALSTVTLGAGSVTHTGGALTANLPVIGAGGADIAVGTRTGNTTQYPTWTGATTAARCVDTDASGNLQVVSADCNSAAFGPNYSVGGGTAQAQTVAPTTAVTNATLTDGYQICWSTIAANSGPAPTLAGSGTSTFSAHAIVKNNGAPLIANDIVALVPYACVQYNLANTQFVLQNPQAGVGALTSLQAYGSAAQGSRWYPSNGCTNGPPPSCSGNYAGAHAGAALSSTTDFQWPLADGSGNAAIVTDGLQNLSAVQLPQYIAGAGSVNVMTATFVPAFSAYVAGEEFDVLPNLANTTTNPTVNVNGLGAKTVTKCGTAVLAAGDYSTTAVAKFIYDGTRLELQNPQVAGCGVPSYIDPTRPVYAGGVKADAHFSSKAVFTNGSNIITCSDCNFTGTDPQGRPIAKVSQIVFGSSATTDVSEQTSTITLAETTILSIDSATQIHSTANVNCGGACGAASTLAWGDLDSLAAGGGAQTTANDPMYSAWNAAATNCLPLQLPAGVMLVERAPFTFVPTDGCNNANEATNTRRGFTIRGYGDNASIIIITPNFPAADCVGGTGSTCFIGLPNPILQDFQLWGLGNSDPGAGFNGKVGVLVLGISPNTNFELSNLQFHGWAANRLTSYGFYIGPNVSGGTIKSVNVEAFGTETCLTDAAFNGLVDAFAFWCTVTNGSGSHTLLVQGPCWFTSTAGLYGWTTNSTALQVKGGAYMTSVGDFFLYQGTYQISATGAGTQLNMMGDYLTGSTNGMNVDAGARVTISNSTISIFNPIIMGAAGTCTTTCVVSSGGNNNFNVTGGGALYTTATGASIFIAPTDKYTASTTLQPTCAFTSGGGTSPSCALQTGSTNAHGVIIATTGTGVPGSTGTITLTFVGTHAVNGTAPVCTYNADDSGTAWGNGAVVKVSTQSTTTPVLAWLNDASNVLAALATSSPYRIDYECSSR